MINAHLIRDCVATTFANDDPNHIRYALHLLGHTGLQTTERNYVTANSRFAVDRHHDLISTIRSRACRRRLREEKA